MISIKQLCKDQRVCIIGAHPDDIELGMAGTINQIKNEAKELLCLVASTSSTIPGNSGITQNLEASMKSMGVNYKICGWQTRRFKENEVVIRDVIYQYKDFDIIFSHSRDSLHPDHRVIGTAVADIMKERTVFCFEEVYSGREIQYNWINEISSEDMFSKIHALDCYSTQSKRPYFKDDSIATQARFRGMMIGKKYAEAFYLLRGASTGLSKQENIV